MFEYIIHLFKSNHKIVFTFSNIPTLLRTKQYVYNNIMQYLLNQKQNKENSLYQLCTCALERRPIDIS